MAVYQQQTATTTIAWRPKIPPPWAHFWAGAAGGISATVLTAPLDIVKTRLQSTLRAESHHASEIGTLRLHGGISAWLRQAGRHFLGTLSIITSIRRNEGTLALFRGLGPNLAGYVPATALKFTLYGNVKSALVAINGQENGWTHLSAGIIAGVGTCTATNPFWVIKTRLQLDQPSNGPGGGSKHYKNSMDCVRQTMRREGIRGLYRGLSASYIGTLETAVQWVFYEHLKVTFSAQHRNDMSEGQRGVYVRPITEAAAAGASKLVAAITLYPHEVLRTRLREAPKGTHPVAIGLRQCFMSIIAKEGFAALYGGLTAHLLRVVPSSAVLFSVYEATLRMIPQQAQ